MFARGFRQEVKRVILRNFRNAFENFFCQDPDPNFKKAAFGSVKKQSGSESLSFFNRRPNFRKSGVVGREPTAVASVAPGRPNSRILLRAGNRPATHREGII